MLARYASPNLSEIGTSAPEALWNRTFTHVRHEDTGLNPVRPIRRYLVQGEDLDPFLLGEPCSATLKS
jgi:hypothetical protein